MKRFELLSLAEADAWRDALRMLPPEKQDVYFTPEYYGVFESLGAGQALCAVFRDGGETAVYPFLINSINALGFFLDREYHDIQGAYGYNGVGASCDEGSFKKSFAETFRGFIEERAIVAEFTRFNPVLKNDSFSDYLESLYSQDNVVLDLTQENIETNAYEHATRKNVNKARRSGLTCKKLEAGEMNAGALDDFVRIYHATMERNNAATYYFFPRSFFADIAARLAKRCAFYFTELGEVPIAAELVTQGDRVAYSFLGGTAAEFFEFRPNDLLKDFIISDLRGRGLNYFCLGGGSAGILRFKKSFAKNGVTPFCIGKKIHDPEIYEKIVGQWQERFPEKEESLRNHVLKYRM
jgi:hypothetical protein